MTQTYTFPIVGAHFRPPAKPILQVLPAGAHLLIEREPDNESDANAVKVSVRSADIPTDAHEELGILASGYGYDLPTILAAEAWHLGYIPRGEAEQLSPMLLDFNAAGRLTFTAAGKPAVSVVLTPKTEALS